MYQRVGCCIFIEIEMSSIKLREIYLWLDSAVAATGEISTTSISCWPINRAHVEWSLTGKTTLLHVRY